MTMIEPLNIECKQYNGPEEGNTLSPMSIVYLKPTKEEENTS